MTYVSSPIAYPPSSSPPQVPESRKRSAPTKLGAAAKKRLFPKDFVLPAIRNEEKPRDSCFTIHAAIGTINRTETSNNPFEEDDPVDDAQGAPCVSRTSIGSASKALASPVDPDHAIPQRNGQPSTLKTCSSSSGKRSVIRYRASKSSISYEKLIAQRSTSAPGRAKTSFYGIEVHKILKEAQEAKPKEAKPKEAKPKEAEVIEEPIVQSVEVPQGRKKHRQTMWTERYRARKFTDLVGDERTHRSVLRWLKAWDPLVFPGAAIKQDIKACVREDHSEEHGHRKILLLTGPPGLGKTTLAHVCAKQAGYEVVEINASDERNRDVVKGKIRDCVGTENVRGVNSKVGEQTIRKAGRPVCVVVDEVDGVVTGSGGGGEGGFVKALIDLILTDQKNSKVAPASSTIKGKKKRGDSFRLLRPIILICNDVYHPSLRPLRSSGLGEILHVRKPPLEKIIARMKHVFSKEGLEVDNDGVRRLCEATWGMSSRKEDRTNSNPGEGDIRGVLVVGEWAASKLRSACRSSGTTPRLTRQWVEKHLISDLTTGGSGARGMGRGGLKEAVDRIFLEGGGFPKNISALSTDGDAQPLPTLSTEKLSGPSSVSATAKATSTSLLRHLIDATGEHDRLTTDLFTQYPSRHFQDDTFLSKPNIAYDWLAFHDSVSNRVHHHQDWELAPYLPQAALAFHNLFASTSRPLDNETTNRPVDDAATDAPLPFTGPRADFAATEAHRATLSTLQSLHASLALPLHRLFRSPQELATGLVPYVNRMLNPDVKPVVVGGSAEARGTASVRREAEREMVVRGAAAMVGMGVEFERVRVEEDGAGTMRGGTGGNGWVWRMEPPLDDLSTFPTASKSTSLFLVQQPPPRYAVRQVLQQEALKLRALLAAEACAARGSGVATASSLARRAGGPVKSGGPAKEGERMAGNADDESVLAAAAAAAKKGAKRDFFGRVIVNEERLGSGAVGSSNRHGKEGVFAVGDGESADLDGGCGGGGGGGGGKRRGTIAGGGCGGGGGGEKARRIWVSYHEGFSNAVRKPIGLRELMDGF